MPPAPPKLEQVMSECDEVKEWVELGAALHMPQSDLDIIENAHSDDPARCRRELFKVRLSIMYMYMCMIMRDKVRRKARPFKQQSKATQHFHFSKEK